MGYGNGLDPNVFRRVTTLKELATSLNVEYKILKYNLYKVEPEKKYQSFEIPKKSGGKRIITVPISGIKHVQTNLNNLLQQIYPGKSVVHGFVKKKSIVTNAVIHQKQRFLVNIDLSDFFTTINFGRVRGLFLSRPFEFNPTIATALAQICCHNGHLPQGAPTSPVISNFICWKMDNELRLMATKNKCLYTRYADDLTFSTSLKNIPTEIGKIWINKIILSKELIDIITNNGFEINESKLRFATKNNRQEVTGLVVNKFPNVKRKYIRNVRAILNAWKKYGLGYAAKVHFEKKSLLKLPSDHESLFKQIVVGKVNFIGLVRGKRDPIFLKLFKILNSLDSKIKIPNMSLLVSGKNKIILYGEGKTDWMHLQAALNFFKSIGRFENLDINFHKYKQEDEVNNVTLLHMCKGHLERPPDHFEICLFDRDVPGILKDVTTTDHGYKQWQNGLFSFVVPKPKHRNFEALCIEHLYPDKDLLKNDSSGRRLFLSTEFEGKSGRHKTLDLNTHLNRKTSYPAIIDSDVFNKNNENVALSKMQFALNIFNRNSGFENIDFSSFENVFVIIEKVVFNK